MVERLKKAKTQSQPPGEGVNELIADAGGRGGCLQSMPEKWGYTSASHKGPGKNTFTQHKGGTETFIVSKRAASNSGARKGSCAHKKKKGGPRPPPCSLSKRKTERGKRRTTSYRDLTKGKPANTQGRKGNSRQRSRKDRRLSSEV